MGRRQSALGCAAAGLARSLQPHVQQLNAFISHLCPPPPRARLYGRHLQEPETKWSLASHPTAHLAQVWLLGVTAGGAPAFLGPLLDLGMAGSTQVSSSCSLAKLLIALPGKEIARLSGRGRTNKMKWYLTQC